MTIDYDDTAAEYEASLVTKLRGHGAGSFLENWVPDPDPVLGIFNMIEAAWTDGQASLSLSVARSTLDAPAVERLKLLAGEIAEIHVEAADTFVQLLTIGRVKRGVASQGHSAQSARSPVSRAGLVARDRERAEVREVTYQVEPSLVAALESETAVFSHEGLVESSTGTVAVKADLAEGTISLSIGQNDGLIRAARHFRVAQPMRRRVVEVMCRAIEGGTLQDASDHAGTYAVHTLQLRAGRRPGQGVLLPSNAGLEVRAALDMIRRACDEYRQRLGVRGSGNYFERHPGEPWSTMDRAGKLRAAAQTIENFCLAGKLAVDAIKAIRVDKDINRHEIRVIVQVDPQLERERVPSTLRRLERFLKANLEPVLEVYLEPFKDQNVLRRL